MKGSDSERRSPLNRSMPRMLVLALAALLVAAPATAAAKPGKLDRRFGSGGVALTRALDGAFAGLVQRDGRILVAGGIFRPGVLRLTSRGRRDRRFGRVGVARSDRSGLPFGIRRLAGGEIRVGMLTTTTNTPPVELLRFSRRGHRLPPAIHEEHIAGPLSHALLRPDGGAYVPSREGIRALTPDATTDPSFSGGVLEPREIPGVRQLAPQAVRPDGRLVLSGRRGGRPHVLQLHPDGTLDRSFGDGGFTRAPFAGYVLRIGRRGELIGAAKRGRYLARVFRLSADGTRRRTFGTGGVAGTWRSKARAYGRVVDVVQDARRRIFVLTATWSGKRVRVLALTRTGRAWRRFGRRGLAALPRPRLPRPRRLYGIEAEDLVVDRRRGLLVIGTRHRGYFAHHPGKGGCWDIREDFCSWQQWAAVWRMRR